MAHVDWRIRATEFANCNCAYGCPCQFNALPTHGDCRAAVAYRIDEGHFGEVSLDGVRAAAMYAWPGPVHEGGGEMQLVIDEDADDEQRGALLGLMEGAETEPMATMWSVFRAMVDTVHEPLFKPIDLAIDVEGRTARVSIPGVLEASGEPIRNPVTGAPHRARIDLPHGFEYALAEVGSGRTRAHAAIPLAFDDTYTQLARIHLGPDGVVR